MNLLEELHEVGGVGLAARLEVVRGLGRRPVAVLLLLLRALVGHAISGAFAGQRVHDDDDCSSGYYVTTRGVAK